MEVDNIGWGRPPGRLLLTHRATKQSGGEFGRFDRFDRFDGFGGFGGFGEIGPKSSVSELCLGFIINKN